LAAVGAFSGAAALPFGSAFPFAGAAGLAAGFALPVAFALPLLAVFAFGAAFDRAFPADLRLAPAFEVFFRLCFSFAGFLFLAIAFLIGELLRDSDLAQGLREVLDWVG
jgi:hypothetical protein